MEKISIVLTTRIREAEEAILDLQARLQALIEERTVLLSAAALDEKSLTRLSTCEQKTTDAIADQRSRMALLREQVEAALMDEAARRVRALEEEYTALGARLQAQHATWLAGLAQLAVLLEANQEDRKQLQLVHDECSFLTERFGVAWASLPAVPLPSRDDITRKLENILRKGSWTVHASNVWAEQRAALRAEKNRLAHQAAEEHRRTARSQSVVKMHVPAA